MYPKPLRPDQGTMLVLCLNLVILLSALAGAFLTITASEHQEHLRSERQLQVFYIAEAGLSDAMSQLTGGGDGNLGSETQPIQFSGGQYYVQAHEHDADLYTLLVKSRLGNATHAIEATVGVDPNGGFYRKAAAATTSVDVLDSAAVDSWDSGLGTYASQAVNDRLGTPYARPAGHVFGNTGIGLGINASIFGNAQSAAVSPIAILPTNFVSGSTVTDPRTLDMADVTEPPEVMAMPSVPLQLSGVDTADLPSGIYRFSDLKVLDDSVLTITGPATIVVDTFLSDAQGSIQVDATAGPVVWYFRGSIQMRGSASIGSYSGRPFDTMLFVSTDNITGFPGPTGNPALPLLIGQQSQLNGVLYAPQGLVNVTDQAQVFGAVYAERVRLTGTSWVHYDESLRRHLLPTGAGLAGTWTGPNQAGPPSLWSLLTWSKAAVQASMQHVLESHGSGDRPPTGSGPQGVPSPKR